MQKHPCPCMGVHADFYLRSPLAGFPGAPLDSEDTNRKDFARAFQPCLFHPNPLSMG